MVENKILIEARILALSEFFNAKYNRRSNLIESEAYKIIMKKVYELIKQVNKSDLSIYKKIKYKRKLQKIAVDIEQAQKFKRLE